LTEDAGLIIPEGGFWPAPQIAQPNIYPMEWRVETEKLAAGTGGKLRNAGIGQCLDATAHVATTRHRFAARGRF